MLNKTIDINACVYNKNSNYERQNSIFLTKDCEYTL